MNREIKFRAWDDKNKKWLLGYDYPNLGGFSMYGECVLMGEWGNLVTSFMFEKDGKKSSDLKLMQFTGLKDKNGKEIYEGDICNYHVTPHSAPPSTIPFLIVFNIDGFQGCNLRKTKTDFVNGTYLKQPERFNYRDWKKLEVIGNIHENQELLTNN